MIFCRIMADLCHNAVFVITRQMKILVLSAFYFFLFTPLLSFWADDYFVQYKTYLPFLLSSILLFVVGYKNNKITVHYSDFAAITIIFLLFLSSSLTNRLLFDFPHILGSFLLVMIWILLKKYWFPSLSNKITIAILIVIWLHVLIAIYGLWFSKLQNIDSVFGKYLLGISHNPSVLTCYLLIFLPIVVHQTQFESLGLKNFGILTILLIIFVIIFNRSRVCILGLAAVFLFFYHLRLQINNQSRKVLITSVIVIMLSSLTFYSLFNSSKKASTDGKLLVLKIASRIGTDYFWQGTGYRSFPSKYMVYQSRYFQKEGSNREAWLTNNKYVADSELLLFWVELGTPIFYIILLLIIYLLYRHYKSNKPFDETPLIRSWSAWVTVLVILFTFSNVLHFPETVNAIFVSSLFYGISIKKHDRPAIILSRETHKIVKIVICSISIGAFLFYSLVIYDLKIWKKRVQTASNYTSYKVDDIKSILMHNGSFSHTSAAIFKSNGNYEEAYNYLKKANQIQVGNMTMLLEAQILQGLGRRQDAYDKYRDAIYAVPIQVIPKYYLMKACEEWGDTTKAVLWAGAILQTPVKVESEERRWFDRRASNLIQKYPLKDSTKIFRLF